MIKQIIGWFRKEPSRKPIAPFPKTFTVTLEAYHLMALLEAATSEHVGNTYRTGHLLVDQLQQDADFAWPIVEQLKAQGFTCLQDGDGIITDIERSEWRA